MEGIRRRSVLSDCLCLLTTDYQDFSLRERETAKKNILKYALFCVFSEEVYKQNMYKKLSNII